MAFTSWCDLKEQMLEDLASGAVGSMQSYSVSTAGGSRSVTYRSYAEWKQVFDDVSAQCAAEGGSVPYTGRYRAGSGGRG